MSTQAMLAGLYREDDAFVDGLPWRPIAVHYVPRFMDEVLCIPISLKCTCLSMRSNVISILKRYWLSPKIVLR